eukprot:COSAG01_NODE_3596_length_5895_cov_13.108351_2_plen_235_part_00
MRAVARGGGLTGVRGGPAVARASSRCSPRPAAPSPPPAAARPAVAGWAHEHQRRPGRRAGGSRRGGRPCGGGSAVCGIRAGCCCRRTRPRRCKCEGGRGGCAGASCWGPPTSGGGGMRGESVLSRGAEWRCKPRRPWRGRQTGKLVGLGRRAAPAATSRASWPAWRLAGRRPFPHALDGRGAWLAPPRESLTHMSAVCSLQSEKNCGSLKNSGSLTENVDRDRPLFFFRESWPC